MDRKTVEGLPVLKEPVPESKIQLRDALVRWMNTIDTVTITTDSDVKSKGSQKFAFGITQFFSLTDVNSGKLIDLTPLQNIFLNIVKIDITTLDTQSYESILLKNNQTFPGKVVVKGANPANINFKYLINYYYTFLTRSLNDLMVVTDNDYRLRSGGKTFKGPEFLNNFNIDIDGNTSGAKNAIAVLFQNVVAVGLLSTNNDKKVADRLDLYNGMLPVSPITLKTSYTSTM